MTYERILPRDTWSCSVLNGEFEKVFFQFLFPHLLSQGLALKTDYGETVAGIL